MPVPKSYKDVLTDSRFAELQRGGDGCSSPSQTKI